MSHAPSSEPKTKGGNVLVVSHYYPPYDCTAAVEAMKFVTHLLSYGWRATVLCASNDFPATLEEPAGIPVIRTKQIDVNWPVKKVAGRRRVAVAGYTIPQGTLRGSLLSRAGFTYRNYINFPDGQIGWYPFAVRAVRRVAQTTPFDVVLSSAYPVTNHLVARHMAASLHVPWVADFRDLWTANHNFQRRGWLANLERKLERRVVQDAAAVTAPSDQWVSYLKETFAQPLGTVVPNAFDPADYPKDVAKPSRFTLTYTGVLYPDSQNAMPLLRAMAELRRKGVLTPQNFRFLCVGRYSEHLLPDIRSLGLDDLAETHESVSHAEALRLQKQASALLFLSWMQEGNEGWYSAKVYEYLGAGRPVLVVGKKGAPAKLIRDMQAGVVTESSQEIVAVLEEWMKSYNVAGDVSMATDPDQLKRFEWKHAVGHLAELLEQAKKGQAPDLDP